MAPVLASISQASTLSQGLSPKKSAVHILPSLGTANVPTVPTSKAQQPPQPVQRRRSGPQPIDYRVSIVCGVGAAPKHRILAHTPPTRAQIRLVALRHVVSNMSTFYPAANGPPTVLQAVVTRVVFSVAGREEAYELADYQGEDLSSLCESMAAAAAVTAGENNLQGGVAHTAWPLFEVTFPHALAAPPAVVVEN